MQTLDAKPPRGLSPLSTTARPHLVITEMFQQQVIDNWGVSKQPGQPKAGGIWIWGYDEITWFAHQSQQYRSNWLAYASDWVGRTDPNGHLEMPGSLTMVSPLDKSWWYYANRPSSTAPEGFGDEDAIKTI